ncbi:MAG: ribosomal RNA small subunit methyltransferase A [Candidatus Melainabacteria bacterium]|nr:ribosomal RNA small subunit methyltransferase A [Candidatus Melainabacteria bacterium]
MLLSPNANYKDLLRLAIKFQTKKRFGQHFLIDPQKLTQIAKALQLSPGDEVLEIGPGLGFLTHFLLADNARVTAVEIDGKCVRYLQDLQLPNLNVIHEDILKCDLRSLGVPKLKVVGNIPYQITSPIVAHLFGEIGQPAPWLDLIDTVVLTVQLEVAERFIATPGSKSYSQATILANYFAEASILEIIPARSFYPAPEVTSAVVRFIPLKKPAVCCKNPSLLRKVIQSGFRQRRKMLKNTLCVLELPPQVIKSALAELNLNPQVRAEKLSLTQLAMLADALEEVVNAAQQPKHA